MRLILVRLKPNNFAQRHFFSSGSKVLVSPGELASEVKTNPNLKLIDTRPVEDYAKGHIEGAVNVSHFTDYLIYDSSPSGMRKLQDDFAEFLGKAGIERKDRTVVYDLTLDKTSPRALFLLNYLGSNDVSLLHGGLALWLAHKLPLTTKVPSVSEKRFVPEINSKIMVTRKEMLEAVENPGSVTIVDDRNRAEWIGESSSPYGVDFCPRKGRIPGAIWIEWLKLMHATEEGVSLYKSTEEIRRICAESGAKDQQKPTYVYCFKGARASNTWLALKLAGYGDVRTYFGSWNEWSRDAERPIDDNKLVAEESI